MPHEIKEEPPLKEGESREDLLRREKNSEAVLKLEKTFSTHDA